MADIKVNQNGTIAKRDWRKVEALPYGGPYANHQSGFDDHINKSGRVYRVRFATWTESKSVTLETLIA